MKMISANKLNRLWRNGVVAKMVAKTKVLKTIEEISANTNAENVAGAMAVKALSNNLATQLPGSVRIISEGSGAAAKYYAQIGADAASKKLLGSEYECPASKLRITSFKTSGDKRLFILTFGKSIKITSSLDNDKTYWKYIGIKAVKEYNQTPAVMDIPNGDALSINTSRIIVNSCEYPAVEVYRHVSNANAATLDYIDIEWV